eukprot:SAG31_NODE_437_length_15714_cov_8.527344_15_plen_107_part_00
MFSDASDDEWSSYKEEAGSAVTCGVGSHAREESRQLWEDMLGSHGDGHRRRAQRTSTETIVGAEPQRFVVMAIPEHLAPTISAHVTRSRLEDIQRNIRISMDNNGR